MNRKWLPEAANTERSPFGDDEDPFLPHTGNIELHEYIPINADSDEALTTESDMNLIDNALVIHDTFLTRTKTIAGLVTLTGSVCKLIETRRKVKKLPFGASVSKAKGWETLE